MKCKYSFVVPLLSIIVLPFLVTPSPGTDALQDLNSETMIQPPQDVISSLDQEIRQTIDTLRQTYLIQELNFTEEKAKHILQKIQDARDVRERYITQSAQIEQQLKILVDVVHPDQAQINKALQTLEVMRTQYYHYVLQADQELRMLLSPEEQARYVLFQRNFQRTLQEMIVRIRQQRAHSPTETNSNILLRKEEKESVIRQAD
jgi:FtsZ-binding cell division protein ZapB